MKNKIKYPEKTKNRKLKCLAGKLAAGALGASLIAGCGGNPQNDYQKIPNNPTDYNFDAPVTIVYIEHIF